ncbi:MAG: PAS domain-containing protein, partial [Planctomycetaceae bacterium]|nr:PAS domain-containing protein [Planctomycetaceae bacterium]
MGKRPFQAMVEDMPINVMTCDLKTFQIDYANTQAIETLKSLQKILPVPVDKIIGTPIDAFHKDPEHQRKLLKDPKNLPHQAVIEIGGEKLDLLISPIYDRSGRYIAPMVTWAVVTEKLQTEEQNLMQQQMLDQLPINAMMCDVKSFKITYANQATLRTLKQIEHLLPIKVNKLVGTCIDQFHKNPRYQRELLSDDSRLPHNAKIKLGDETLDLRIAPVKDKDGEMIAALVTWAVVTRQVKMVADFETNIKTVVEGVSSAATQMQSTSESMASAAEETSCQARTVATASEELSASIDEIRRRVGMATQIAANAVDRANDSKRRVNELVEASQKITSVTKLINQIASQTNLLALNATVEATRAGEAGKGFAVVANEVKALADQTARATAEIRNEIEGMQNATTATNNAMAAIADTIEKINENADAMAVAIEQQAAATKEVNSSISEVSQASSASGKAATETLTAAADLSTQANVLSEAANHFL